MAARFSDGTVGALPDMYSDTLTREILNNGESEVRENTREGTRAEEKKTYVNSGSGKTGQIQEYVVKKSGMYTIEVWGAEGGHSGGKGARMKGDFELEKNDIFIFRYIIFSVLPYFSGLF